MFSKRPGKVLFFFGMPIRQVVIRLEDAHYYVFRGLYLTSISTDWILC